MTVWRFLDFRRCNAFENMAIDEAIFQETVKNKKPPTLRFYGWQPPAVSIGYFQNIEQEINVAKCRACGIDVVRRLSGGKAVFHFREVTYSVVACAEEELFPHDILGTYKIISNCLTCGLSMLGLEAVLVEDGRNFPDTDFKTCCFSLPSQNELLVSGRKICGSAQMRTSGGFLQHGSILLDFDPVQTASFLLPACTSRQIQELNDSVTAVNREVVTPVDEDNLCAVLKQGFIKMLGREIIEDKLTSEEDNLVRKLMGKYTDSRWNSKGKKEAFRIDG